MIFRGLIYTVKRVLWSWLCSGVWFVWRFREDSIQVALSCLCWGMLLVYLLTGSVGGEYLHAGLFVRVLLSSVVFFCLIGREGRWGVLEMALFWFVAVCSWTGFYSLFGDCDWSSLCLRSVACLPFGWFCMMPDGVEGISGLDDDASMTLGISEMRREWQAILVRT